MNDYISKGDAYIEFMKCKDFDTDKLYHGNHYLKIACDVIRSIPPADVVERKKGKWIKGVSENGVTTSLFCSECNLENLHWYEWNYCPNCGAEME